MKQLNRLVVSATMMLLLTGCETGYYGSPPVAQYPSTPPPRPAAPPPGAHRRAEPWVDVSITTSERQVIRAYLASHAGPGESHGKGKKPKHLPPGLQKKVARGGSLPPGWERKVARGEVLPADVYEQCQPLPREVIVKLPPPPPGTILIVVGGKVARLLAATREILDVFDVE